MNKQQKKCLLPLLALFINGHQPLAQAVETTLGELNNTVGAVDYYKITCDAVGTEHLNFQIKDITDTTVEPQPPQLINAQITKDGLAPLDISELKSGDDAAEFDLPGGSGKYTIKLDTIGTDPSLNKNSQTYTLEYQCLSSDDQVIKSSLQTKTLKNGKTAKIVANCGTKKINKVPVSSDRLHIKLTNITPETQNQKQLLQAQVIKSVVAQVNAYTTYDTMGDELYGKPIDLWAGTGDYVLMVSHTGYDDNDDNTKPYEFQTSCLDADDNETGSPVISVVQDQ